jgi:hypothetical protein
MTGSSIFEYIHENDHCELTEQLGLSVTTNNNNTTTNSGMTSPSSFNEETTGNGSMSLVLHDTLYRFQLTFELIESLYNLISHANDFNDFFLYFFLSYN